jgi:hypothetical protein
MADPAELPDVTGLTPFLQTYRAVGDLKQHVQQQGLQSEFIRQRQALGPNPSPQDLTGLAMKFASPQDMMHYGIASQDRQAALAQHLLQFKDLAQNRIDALEEKRRESVARLTDKGAQDAVNNAFKQQQLALQQQLADTNEFLKKMGLDIQQQKLDQTKNQQTNKQTQNLGTALERAGLNESHATLQAVEDALQKRPDIAEYLSGPKSLFPNAALPNDVVAGRQAFQKLFNITLKNRSGAAVTPPEFERLKQEFATGAFNSPESLKTGVEQARNIISKHYQGIAAGYPPEALQEYNQNLRDTGGTSLLESQSTPTTPANDIETAVKRSGIPYEPSKFEYRVSNGKVQRKKK